ncbi:MAG: hypothetical protein SNG57_00065, partial [Rikenellaceae bacterium]
MIPVFTGMTGAGDDGDGFHGNLLSTMSPNIFLIHKRIKVTKVCQKVQSKNPRISKNTTKNVVLWFFFLFLHD